MTLYGIRIYCGYGSDIRENEPKDHPELLELRTIYCPDFTTPPATPPPESPPD